MDWKAILPSLIANLIALMVGVPVGLYLDRYIRRKKEKEESALHRRAIANEIATNLKILNNISQVLGDENNKKTIPIPNVLLNAWETAKHQGFLEAATGDKSLPHLIMICRDLEEIKLRIEQLWSLTSSGISIVGDTGSQFRLLADRASYLATDLYPKIDKLFAEWKIAQ